MKNLHFILLLNIFFLSLQFKRNKIHTSIHRLNKIYSKLSREGNRKKSLLITKGELSKSNDDKESASDPKAPLMDFEEIYRKMNEYMASDSNKFFSLMSSDKDALLFQKLMSQKPQIDQNQLTYPMNKIEELEKPILLGEISEAKMDKWVEILEKWLGDKFLNEAAFSFSAFKRIGRDSSEITKEELQSGFKDFSWVLPTSTYEEAADIYFNEFGGKGLGFKEFVYMMIEITSAFTLSFECKYCLRVTRYEISFFFQVANSKKDGKLTFEEFSTAMKLMGLEEDAELKKAFESFRSKNEKYLTFQETQEFLLKSLWELKFLIQKTGQEAFTSIVKKVLADDKAAIHSEPSYEKRITQMLQEAAGKESANKEKDAGKESANKEKDAGKESANKEKDAGKESANKEKDAGKESANKEKDAGKESANKEKDAGKESATNLNNEVTTMSVLEESSKPHSIMNKVEKSKKEKSISSGEEKEDDHILDTLYKKKLAFKKLIQEVKSRTLIPSNSFPSISYKKEEIPTFYPKLPMLPHQIEKKELNGPLGVSDLALYYNYILN